MNSVLGHGVDIVELAEFGALLEQPGDHLAARCFTERELGSAGEGGRRISRLAARFAAKEAVLKSLGTGWVTGLGWKDIEIVNEPNGAPRIELSGGVANLAALRGASHFLVSLSHSRNYAVASVIALGVPPLS